MQAQTSEFLATKEKNRQDTIIQINAIHSLFTLISMFVLFGVAWGVVITQLNNVQRQINHVENTIAEDIKPFVSKIPSIETKTNALWQRFVIGPTPQQ